MKGRKPKPSRLKLVTGNPGKRKVNKKEPKPTRMIPSAPEHLGDQARLAWGSFAARLDRLGLLTELDALALERLCENYAEVLELQQEIRDRGRFQTVTTKSGDEMERARPVVAAYADAERRFRTLLAEFGMTPSARSRIQVEADATSSDPAEAYFG